VPQSRRHDDPRYGVTCRRQHRDHLSELQHRISNDPAAAAPEAEASAGASGLRRHRRRGFAGIFVDSHSGSAQCLIHGLPRPLALFRCPAARLLPIRAVSPMAFPLFATTPR